MDYFSYKNGVYHAEDVAISDIAKAVGTPFYCYSAQTFLRHYDVFSQHFAHGDSKICFAAKANSNVAILALLASKGCGADVVSSGEIRLAKAAGMPPSDIVFSGVGKTKEEMAFALQEDIFQFNVESLPELDHLNEVAQGLGLKARVALRVNPDVDPKTHAKISTGQKESKFGISMSQSMDAFAHAASLPAIDVRGVSVHIGSQLTSLEPFAKAFARVRVFVEELRAAGHEIRTLDLGGGLGIPYGQADQTAPDPKAYAEVVHEATQGLGCQLIFEPGRMIAGNAGILVMRVLYIKESQTRKFVIADGAMNDLMRPTLYSAHHDIVPIQEAHGANMQPYDVVGPVCETGDIFAEQRELPELQPDDLMAIRSVGAYGAVMASTYNARPLIPEVLVHADRFDVIRERQPIEALIERDIIPDWLK